MNVQLIDFDSKIPNLALMRISAYHKKQGDTIRITHGEEQNELFYNPDKVYLSCIFRWNKNSADFTASMFDGRIEVGGTGVDITSELSSDIKNSEPDYSLYPEFDYAIGFISRGCIRKCPWCVVPRKEGGLQRVATAKEIVGNKKTAIFLDNNFLALSDYDKDLIWLSENRVAIDFNQALDARLVDDRAAYLMSRCKWNPGIRMSLDSEGMINSVKKAIDNLAKYGVKPSTIRIFTLIGFSSFEDDVNRLLTLHEWGCAPFPMGYRNIDTGEEPAVGWDRNLYKKYKRLITRLPMANSVWEDFGRDVVADRNIGHRIMEAQ